MKYLFKTKTILMVLLALAVVHTGLAQNSNASASSRDTKVERKNYSSPNVAKYSTLFPHAVVAGDFIFISGMPGLDPVSGKVPGGDLEAQTRQAYQNVKIVLEELGSDMSKIVKITQFVVTGNEMTAVNKVFKEVFPEVAPARSSPMVMPFPAGILISVDCIALR